MLKRSKKVKKKELSAYYAEGQAIEAKLNHYKHQKESVIKRLRFLDHLISNIEGKLKEVDTALDGDLRLEVTSMHPSFPFVVFGIDAEGEDTVIKGYVREYNSHVKNQDFVAVKKTLLELRKILTDFQQEREQLYFIDHEKFAKKAHTPIVIRERKRKKNE